MSSGVMVSMTIGKVATISPLVSLGQAQLVSLGQAESEIVGRRRGERLVEGRADGRLLHVDRLDLTQLPLRRGLEGPPAELREVSGAAHPGGGRREERLRTEEVAERLLGLGND